jgi:hypothetical protein
MFLKITNFLKIIFDTSTSKRSENIKIIILNIKNSNFKITRFEYAFPNRIKQEKAH